MHKIYYCKLYPDNSKGNGLCNQLFVMVSGIIIAIKLKYDAIIIDNFLVDYQMNLYTQISKIINIHNLNLFLQNTYNISIYDRYDISNTQLSMIAQKQLTKQTKQTRGIMSMNINKSPFIYNFKWIDELDKDMFDNILSKITFTSFYLSLATTFLKIKNINNTEKINVLHLRLENDAIMHWAKMNKMVPLVFQHIIEEKYIGLIKKYINKNEINIILSYSTDNKVIQFLKENNYKYFFTDKLNVGREINASIDLNIGNFCNHLFIGNFNLENISGSSLSYFLINKYKKENRNIKLVLIDLDKIQDKENINFEMD
jgi:hypothetical protein